MLTTLTVVLLGVLVAWTATLDTRYAQRLSDPLVWMPTMTLLVALLIGFVLGFRSRRHFLPLFCALGVFILAFALMIAALFPMIVPPQLTLQAAASSPNSQIFMLVGFAVLIPVTLIYNTYGFSVLSGKVRVGRDSYPAELRSAPECPDPYTFRRDVLSEMLEARFEGEDDMTTTVGDFLIERLSEWGVTRIFGYPGDGINGVFGALSRAKGKIEFVQARHEEMAAFMASAHAKFTGELGVCIATSGPGASHLITGLYDARMDHMPVLAIVGQQARTALGSHYQQELDLLSMFKDVAGAFVQQASAPAQVRHLIDRAVRTAIGERRVTAIILPNDVQDLEYEAPARAHGTAHSGVGYSKPRVVPYEADLQRAADVLNAGEKVAILVGAGALQATDQVIAVAEKLGAGVAKALLGKAALPDDLPWVTGSIGLLGTEPSYKLMTECDTLLMIGSGFPYSEFLPKEGQARGVQIDLQPDMLSLRYPMEVNLVDDAAETLAALLPLLEQKTERKWRRKSRAGAVVGRRPWKNAPWSKPNRSIRNGWSTSCHLACRSGRSSPATPVRAPTGMPAI